MSDIKDDAAKAANALKQEEGWIERNPGWTTLGALTLLGVIIVLLVKSCA